MTYLPILGLLISLVVYIYIENKQKNTLIDSMLLIQDSDGVKENIHTVIDVKLFDISFKAKIRKWFKIFIKVFYPNALLKIVVFTVISSLLIFLVNEYFLRLSFLKVFLLAEPVLFLFFYIKLKELKKKSFQDNFPDALNILASAMSSGQSIVHAFDYVGKQLDNDVGNEFKYVANRLLIGEDPEEVLEKSCLRFPYLEYFFFVSSIRVNIARGGQLRDVIVRINRLVFSSRGIEKKKNALTSEARASAKIIAVLPILFLIIMRFFTPDNYEFIMYDDAGRPILFYVIGSIFIGFVIIWKILKGADNG